MGGRFGGSLHPGAESRLEVGAAQPLFEAPATPRPPSFDAFADGQRFLINTVRAQDVTALITGVVSWTAEAKK